MGKIARQIFASLILCGVCFVSMANTYVIAIGIEDYAYINDLNSTEDDVLNFTNVMQRHTRDIYTLTGRDATHQNILKTMKMVFQMASYDDAVILYFSGHGFQGGFCCYDVKQNGDNALTYSEIQTIFKECKAKRKMIFADACYSGGVRQGKNNNSSQNLLQSEVMLFLSSRSGEISLENSKSGYYTQYLVKGLRGGADVNRDRIITAYELFKYVHDKTVEQTRDKQHPVMWGKFEDNMAVLNWNLNSK